MFFDSMKKLTKTSAEFLKAFIKWTVISLIVGVLGGIAGSLFHILIDFVTKYRTQNSYIILLLPVGGAAIVLMYRIFRSKGNIDTNRVIDSARGEEKVPFVMAPLIFVGTVITHLFGGSAGREGAALQLGGSIGYNIGKVLRLNKNDMRLIVMAGMSSVFAALFGTPVTASVFALEVINVGVLFYAGLLPCIIASLAAYMISMLFGISPVRFSGIVFGKFSPFITVKVAILSVLCAMVSIIFCNSIKYGEEYSKKYLKNDYLRVVVLGGAVAALTFLIGTFDYNGAGMNIVERAISGEARPEAFILKILFTVLTLSAGFKGGEIVPTFFIGSTFGCFAGGLLGLDPGFGAAIGLVALFCGVVNCPLASMVLSVEVFGADGLLFFALACCISYLMSGYSGLYKSQKFVYSKLDTEFIDKNTK